MIQKVFFGNTNTLTAAGKDLFTNEKIALSILVVLILVIGVYPKPFLELTESTVQSILSMMVSKHPK
jgi:NADH-quinone oxidoreductase subunit M